MINSNLLSQQNNHLSQMGNLFCLLDRYLLKVCTHTIFLFWSAAFSNQPILQQQQPILHNTAHFLHTPSNEVHLRGSPPPAPKKRQIQKGITFVSHFWTFQALRNQFIFTFIQQIPKEENRWTSNRGNRKLVFYIFPLTSPLIQRKLARRRGQCCYDGWKLHSDAGTHECVIFFSHHLQLEHLLLSLVI